MRTKGGGKAEERERMFEEFELPFSNGFLIFKSGNNPIFGPDK